MSEETPLVSRKTWDEFRGSGLLWWINTTLHTFGWAICVSIDYDGNVVEAFPSRVKFRGFDEKSVDEGYVKVTRHLKENIDTLIEDLDA
jgi:hypothetical protein